MTERKDIGIRCVSFGPFLFRACLGSLSRLLDDCVAWQTEACFGADSLTGVDVEPYLNRDQVSEVT